LLDLYQRWFNTNCWRFKKYAKATFSKNCRWSE